MLLLSFSLFIFHLLNNPNQLLHNFLLILPVSKLYLPLKISKGKLRTDVLHISTASLNQKVFGISLAILEERQYFLQFLFIRDIVIDAAFASGLDYVLGYIIVGGGLPLYVCFVVELVIDHAAEQLFFLLDYPLLFLEFYLVQNAVVFKISSVVLAAELNAAQFVSFHLAAALLIVLFS